MIKNIKKEENIFIAEAVDMVTKEDVEKVVPLIEEMLKEHKKIKYLVIIDKMKGYTLDGFLADFGFYFKHKSSFGYMAIVGNEKHEKAITSLLNIFYRNKAKYFLSSDIDKAKEWIKSA